MFIFFFINGLLYIFIANLPCFSFVELDQKDGENGVGVHKRKGKGYRDIDGNRWCHASHILQRRRH